MNILDVSQYFDQDQVTDGYTGAELFYAQTASFDDSQSDGATFRRRIMSFAPDLTVPNRRVMTIYGDRWLAGTATPDGFQGEKVRQHVNMKRCTDLMSLLTPAEALSGAMGVQCYVNKTYFKDTTDALTSTEYSTFWNIFVAPSEGAVRGMFFRDESDALFRVRNTYLPAEGLVVCQSDTMDASARTTAIFETGTYDPVSDAFSTGTVPCSVIALDIPQFYRFEHMSDELNRAGDKAVFLPSTLQPKRNDKFVMNGAAWLVLHVQAEQDAFVAHARRA